MGVQKALHRIRAARNSDRSDKPRGDQKSVKQQIRRKIYTFVKSLSAGVSRIAYARVCVEGILIAETAYIYGAYEQQSYCRNEEQKYENIV